MNDTQIDNIIKRVTSYCAENSIQDSYIDYIADLLYPFTNQHADVDLYQKAIPSYIGLDFLEYVINKDVFTTLKYANELPDVTEDDIVNAIIQTFADKATIHRMFVLHLPDYLQLLVYVKDTYVDEVIKVRQLQKEANAEFAMSEAENQHIYLGEN